MENRKIINSNGIVERVLPHLSADDAKNVSISAPAGQCVVVTVEYYMTPEAYNSLTGTQTYTFEEDSEEIDPVVTKEVYDELRKKYPDLPPSRS